jgi:hypothetical protein
MVVCKSYFGRTAPQRASELGGELRIQDQLRDGGVNGLLYLLGFVVPVAVGVPTPGVDLALASIRRLRVVPRMVRTHRTLLREQELLPFSHNSTSSRTARPQS